MSNPVALRSFGAWSRALLAGACSIVVIASVTPPADADQSVIDLINKQAAEKDAEKAAAEKAAAEKAHQGAVHAPGEPRTTAKSKRPHTAKPTAAKGLASLPDPVLLVQQHEPDCAFKAPVSTPITAEETRMKLDYEAQCYRQSEAIVRARLQTLQEAVSKMVKAAVAHTVASSK